jgi:hypothetical protein
MAGDLSTGSVQGQEWTPKWPLFYFSTIKYSEAHLIGVSIFQAILDVS